MKKFRLYLDKDKETEWLNQLAKEGYALKKFFAGVYTFEACTPGTYTYQIDFGNKLFSVSDDYREFMNESGIEIVSCWGYWGFLRKLASEGEFQLYTDVESNIEHYTKIKLMFKIVAVIEILCTFIELLCGFNGASMGYPFACIAGAFAIAFINMAFRTNNTIIKLRERRGEPTAKCQRNNIHILLPTGLLVNSCALMLDESISDSIHLIVQLFAIVLMLIGTYLTAKQTAENNSDRS